MGDAQAVGDRPQVDFLAHKAEDHVAVAVRDVDPGPASVAWLHSTDRQVVEVAERIPLGHKVALADLDAGSDVLEYGVRVALTRSAVKRGDMVHVHNVRSARWQNSGA